MGRLARSIASRAHLWQIAGLALLVIGARWSLIARHGSSVPILDQWDNEGAALLVPWLENKLTWSDFFAPHNEHRLVFTRLLALMLTAVNGQWDARLELVVNAVLWGLFASLLVATLLRLTERPLVRSSALAGAAILFAAPFSTENTLWGVQNAFYFMIGFSLVAIWGLSLHQPRSLQWWAGLVSALIACVHMASGMLIGAAVLGLQAIRLIRSRERPSDPAWWITSATCAGILLFGWLIKAPTPPHHLSLHSDSASSFVAALMRCLAWPFSNHPWMAWVLWLPIAVALVRYVVGAKRESDLPLVELVLAAACWTVLQAAAIAFARGNSPEQMPAERYLDLLATALFFNALLAVSLLPDSRAGWGRRTGLALVSLWLILVVGGVATQSLANIRKLPGRQNYLRQAGNNITAYLLTHDAAYLNESNNQATVYPDSARLADILNHEPLQRVLAAEMRLPLSITIEQPVSDGFIPDAGWPAGVGDTPKVPTWGSFTLAKEAAVGGLTTRPVAITMPYLRVPIAGYVGKSGLQLAFVDAATGATWRCHPRKPPGPRWRDEYIAVGSSTVRLEAKDESSTRWFAFAAPFEMGRLSFWAVAVVEQGNWLFSAGALMGAAGIVLAAAKPIERRTAM